MVLANRYLKGIGMWIVEYRSSIIKIIMLVSVMLTLSGCQKASGKDAAYSMHKEASGYYAVTSKPAVSDNENITGQDKTTSSDDVLRPSHCTEFDMSGAIYVDTYATVINSDFKFNIISVAVGNSFEPLYDMMDKNSADAFVKEILNDSEFTRYSDPSVCADTDFLFLKCNIENTSDEPMYRQINMAFAYSFDNEDIRDISSYMGAFYGEKAAYVNPHTGNIVENMYFFEPHSKLETVYFIALGKMNTLRPTAENINMYLLDSFLEKDRLTVGNKVSKGTHLFPIVKNGKVVEKKS